MEQKEYKIFEIVDLLLAKNFDEAKVAVNQLLPKFPKAGRLYVYKIMADLGAQYPEDLVDIGVDFTSREEYKLALQNLSPEDLQDLASLVGQITSQHQVSNSQNSTNEMSSNQNITNISSHQNYVVGDGDEEDDDDIDEDEEIDEEDAEEDDEDVEGDLEIGTPHDSHLYDSAFYSNGKIYIDDKPINPEDYEDYDIVYNDRFIMVPLTDDDDEYLIVDKSTGSSVTRKTSEGLGTLNGVDLDDLYSDLI